MITVSVCLVTPLYHRGHFNLTGGPLNGKIRLGVTLALYKLGTLGKTEVLMKEVLMTEVCIRLIQFLQPVLLVLIAGLGHSEGSVGKIRI
jgi:hypothetical protein